MSPLTLPRSPGRPKGVDSSCYDGLLTAALSSFTCHGFDGVSLRTIANAAGFNVSMVSHHFGSKADLWQAVVDAIVQDHQDTLLELKELNAPDRPLTIRVMEALNLLIDRLAERPEIIMFVTREISNPGERLDYLVEQLLRPSTEACVPLWNEAMDAGLLRRVNPVIFHLGLFGSLAMILASRPIVARLGGGDMGIEQLKAEIHRGLNLGQFV
ncbi:TetR/AcrR family transcriptional regulator [Dechloromonas sp. H13]|uniref:TetR/AcrR family transcriptional regulator n=1 Tax=Dechloromonas sp. H13 TaxID=2570193 RepID=UPI001884E727|nr:TetR/AcrR family transcriptional regulator [Dechloromonas sp. H13]